MNTEAGGYIASPDGRVYFIGRDRLVVEAVAEAIAAPLNESTMNDLEPHIKRMERYGKEVVLLDDPDSIVPRRRSNHHA